MSNPIINGTRKGKIAYYTSLKEVGDQYGGWVIGHFIKDERGEPLTKDFEVRFSLLSKGEMRDRWSYGKKGSAFIAILSGTVRFVVLLERQVEERVLHPGEALFWENRIPHKWEALQDSQVMVVRTPSPVR